MANIKSALKRIKVAEFKTRRNKIIISSLKTSIRKFEDSVKAGNLEEAQALLRKAVSLIDKAAAKGSLHKNTASRKKSRLSNKLKAAM
ncbi:MAG: 30S ribosomal protein S20 [Lutispora sp.]|nr:30S ribosomal protein S20 [Lutispora sp.]MDD4833351.1 30S ribosomal protein S20 [Lutispora sp.]